MQTCKKCNKSLNSRNNVGYCQEHRHLSPKQLEAARRSYHKNKEHKSEYGKVYCEANKEKISARKKLYYIKNKEKIDARIRKYGKEHREELNIIAARDSKKRYNNDPLYKLIRTCRSRITIFLNLNGLKKTRTSMEYIGCTKEELKVHIESQFLPGMTWENQGIGPDKWVIDHIVPLSSATTENRIYMLSHYTNLQPLWHRANAIKSDTICPLIWKTKIVEAG